MREISHAELLAATHLPSRSFYERPTEAVGRDLLGAVLVHQSPDGILAGRIVEVEAYLGDGDPAAHSSAGITKRTRVIFGPPGHAYVYRIYGVHCCLNVVAEQDGTPGCVLIRSLEPVCGIGAMRARRGPSIGPLQVANGPGKLTSALAIGMQHYGADLLTSPLTIRLPDQAGRVVVRTTRRIGISRAKELQLRFFIAYNDHVSRPWR